MAEDPRCCGSGTCIIDREGRCWCGQQWDGEKMAAPRASGEQTLVLIDPETDPESDLSPDSRSPGHHPQP